MPRTTSRRPQSRILQATLVAGLFGGAPSVLYSLQHDGPRRAWEYGLRATRAIATLVPSRPPSLALGAAAHFGVSLAVGQALGRALPRRRSVVWGAASGAAMGFVGAGVVGRRFAAIRELPFGRQLADNIAFGVIFALVADRSDGRRDRAATSLDFEFLDRKANVATRRYPRLTRHCVTRP